MPRLCRYESCVNALDDLSNVCPHHEAEDGEICKRLCGEKHDDEKGDAKCKCWITCNECLADMGLDSIEDKDLPSTVKEVA